MEGLEDRRLLTGDIPPLVDINAVSHAYEVTFIEAANFVDVGNAVFFRARTPTTGTELWKTDGTAEGTFLVNDIRVGMSSSYLDHLTNLNGTLYFSATDGVHGRELWRSDGTVEGTQMVKDIAPGVIASDPRHLTNVNGTLYFTAYDGVYGRTELWRSDGTAEGTIPVRERVGGMANLDPSSLTNVNGTLYFRASDGVNGHELWMSDGTAEGTVMVKDIFAGTGPSYAANSSNPANLTNVGGTLYFTADDGVSGRELWRSDGTAEGTVRVKDIVADSSSSDPTDLTNVNGTLYFAADDGVSGRELWRSDGTEEGTVQVKDIVAGSGSPDLRYLTDVNGVLYFAANDGLHGEELWRSDGTAEGTVLVKDIFDGTSHSYPRFLTNLNGVIYFAAYEGEHFQELWQSDGTAEGTVLVKDIGPFSSYLSALTNVNGTLYFGANHDELWQSDGTAEGTVMVKDTVAGTSSSSPGYLTNMDGTLYFRADDGVSGNELWRSDGTAAGTVLVKDIAAGANWSGLRYLTRVNGVLYFAAYDHIHGNELWRSDGTAAGTMLVKDIRAGASSTLLRSLTNVGGLVYFTADDGVSGRELWRSDGTADGTFMVKDIRADLTSSDPSYLKNVDGTLYFTVDDGVHGNELWRSDGTADGTIMVKDIRTGAHGSSPRHLTNVDGLLYFTADDGVHGNELWRSDGTADGTAMVKDIRAGASSSFPRNLTRAGGLVYFSAFDGVSGIELWRSDGSEAGTVLVKDIVAGPSSSLNPISAHLTNVNGTLYFSAYDGVHGEELWRSDGTEAGTMLVKDVFAGASSSYLSNLTNVNGTLYFNANDGVHGQELWLSDGTVAGTVLALDIAGDSGGSLPWGLTVVGTTLFFVATTDSYGVELYALALNSTPTLTAEFDGLGNLTITDIGGKHNDVTISVSGSNVVITDAREAFVAPPLGGTLHEGNKTLTIPLTVLSGSIIISTSGGDDTVTIDFSSANPLHEGGLTFDGGAGDDRLRIVGYSLIDADGTADLVATNTSFNSGSVELAGLGTVNFDKIAALTLGGTVADVAIQLPPGADSVALGDDGSTQDGNGNAANISALYVSTGPAQAVTFIEFSNPTNSLWIKRGDATVDLNVLDLAVANMTASLAIGEMGGEFDQVTFCGRLVLAEHKSLAVTATGAITLATADADLAASGTGSITLTTARNIVLSNGSSLTTVNGALTLQANQQGTPTSGNFIGVDVNGGTIEVLGSGTAAVSGRGGDSGFGDQHGVRVGGGGQIVGGTNASLAIQGTGGPASGSGNIGVLIDGVNSPITSYGGDVLVTGTGGGVEGTTYNQGVRVLGGTITAGDNGTVTVVGHGGNMSGTGGSNFGVSVEGWITSSGGNVSVTGTGGNTAGTGNDNFGVIVAGENARITSGGGHVVVTGTGGGAGNSVYNLGVLVENAGTITAGGSGSVTVVGTGSGTASAGDWAYGVLLAGSDARITSNGGDIEVVGTPGSGPSSFGIASEFGGQIVATTGTPTVTLHADSMELTPDMSILAGGNTVVLEPKTVGTVINLGGADVLTGGPLTLGLTDAELDRITAGVIRIGTQTSGPLTITSLIQPAGIGTLHLISGGAIDDGEQGQLIVSQLAAESQGSITLNGYLDSGTPVYHQVGVFAGSASAPGSSLTFISQGGTVIGTVDGISGASANGGGVTVITHSPLTVDAPVIEQGGGPIRLVASTEDGVNDHLTINSPVQVLGGSGGIQLTAGSDVRITSNAASSGSVLTAGGGTISIVAEQGIAIVSASITAQGGGHVELAAGTNLVVQAGETGASITAQGGGSVDLSAGADLVIQADAEVAVVIAADGQGTVAATAGGYVDVDGTVDISTESEPPSLSGTARLTVAVNPASRLYGQENPQFSVSYAGFAPGHDASVLTGTLSYATNAITTSDVGDYAVSASGLTFVGSGLVYEIQFADGVLTVHPAPLTVTVNDAHRVEGGANPPFTVRYDGFVLDHDASVLGGAVSFLSGADESSPPGAYVIAAEGLTAHNYDITFVSGTLTIHPSLLKLYSISGLVYVDFNSDGEVNFGENGIAGVAVTLTGTNDLGQTVVESVWTDDDGFYKFSDLRPGTYHVTESQPESFLQGLNGVGTLGGVLSGVDQFFLELGEIVDTEANTDGLNYNFGERPPADGTIQPGQTAGIGFWQNNNGQALIQSLNGGAQATQLGDWLAATLPGMFAHLSGRSNTEVGSYFRTLFAVRGQKLEAQVMATALAVYITNESLAGTAGQAYGFVVTQYGVGNRQYNVGINGAAFGVQDHSNVSVLDLLRATDQMAVGGVLYYSQSSALMKALRNMANNVYSGING